MTALLVTLAMAADLLTANPATEQSPFARAILAAGYGFAAKTALCAGVLAVVVIARRQRPDLARLVAVVAVLAGAGGAWSNVA